MAKDEGERVRYVNIHAGVSLTRPSRPSLATSFSPRVKFQSNSSQIPAKFQPDSDRLTGVGGHPCGVRGLGKCALARP